MITFYRAHFPGQSSETAVIVADDSEAEVLWEWVPNTGLWHRATQLENDFLFGDEGGTYTAVTAEEAAGLLARVPRLDRRRDVAARMLQRYEAQPPTEKRTNAEMGLTNKLTAGLRPMATPGLGQLLNQASRHRSWRTVNLYGPGTGSAARQFVSQWNHRRLSPQEPALELKTTTRGENIAVEARFVSKNP